MTATAAKPLVWLDMEMTGLDPQVCVPIEVAVVVTDADLNELASMEAVIHQPDEALASMNEVVRRMHTDNGLLARVTELGRPIADVEAEMVALLEPLIESRSGVLAGNSIHTDRMFIRRYLPAFDAQLHYRMVDVSSIKELVRRWYGEDALFAKPESDHTALADCRASIAELAFYRQKFWIA